MKRRKFVAYLAGLGAACCPSFLRAEAKEKQAAETAMLKLKAKGAELVHLRPQPGDLIILKVDHHITVGEAASFREMFQDILPPGVKVAIVGPGVEVFSISNPMPEFEWNESTKAAFGDVSSRWWRRP